VARHEHELLDAVRLPAGDQLVQGPVQRLPPHAGRARVGLVGHRARAEGERGRDQDAVAARELLGEPGDDDRVRLQGEMGAVLEERSDGRIRLNAGSLYRTIGQLVDQGLVEHRKEEASPAGVGAPRKIYGVTGMGRAVLRAEARRQEELLKMARALDLAEG